MTNEERMVHMIKFGEVIKHPSTAYDYMCVHGPDPILEKIIATSAPHSFWYAKNHLHGRFIQGEQVISILPNYSAFKNIYNNSFGTNL